MTKSVTSGEVQPAPELPARTLEGQELFHVIATAAEARFAADSRLGDPQRRKLMVALLRQVARHARDHGVAALTATDAAIKAFSIQKWNSGETRVQPSGRGPITQKIDRVVGHWMKAFDRERRSHTATAAWTGPVPSIEGAPRFRVTFHFTYPRRKAAGRRLAITVTIAELIRSGDYDRPLPIACSIDLNAADIHLTEASTEHPISLKRIDGWLLDRYAALPPHKRAEVDEKSAKGPLGIVAALMILILGCAAAVYYIATRDITVVGREIKTEHKTLVTVLRWRAAAGIHPPFEIFRDGRQIGQTHNFYYVDPLPERADTAIPPTHVYRIAAHWEHLVRKTSAIAVVDNLVRPMMPCTDGISGGLCWPRFTVEAMLRQNYEAFATPLDHVAVVGSPFRVRFENLPQEADGEPLEITSDAAAPHRWNLESGDRRGVVEDTMTFTRPGRTQVHARTATPDGSRPVLVVGNERVNVLSLEQLLLWGVAKPLDFPIRDASKIRLIFVEPRADMVQVTKSLADGDDTLTVDFGVYMPSNTPYMPLISFGDDDREHEMVLVDATQLHVEPRTIKSVYWTRHRYRKPGIYTVTLKGRQLIDDRNQLATLSFVVPTAVDGQERALR